MESIPNVQAPLWLWGGFLFLVLGVLTVDNLLVDKKAHRIALKEALTWSGVWIGLALLFGAGLAFWDLAGPKVASKFAAGYLLELSLSVDNLFIFILIFTHYKVPPEFHHKVLSWGIYGAIVMRGIFIGLGSAIVSRWSWVLVLFGVFLVYTGVKLLFHKNEEMDPADSPITKLGKKLFRLTDKYEGAKFFVRKKGLLWATPLFLIVFIVELTDVLFAFDSIPAVFAITQDPFVVYTSNIFAILGLRSMFFALEGVMHMFRFLKLGLAILLTLIGIKLMVAHIFHVHVHEFVSLGGIVGILGACILASVLIKEKKPAKKKK